MQRRESFRQKQGGERLGASFAFAPAAREQDADVLAGCDEVILDRLPPQPAPAGAFEAMVVGAIGKASLHEMLAPPPVAPGGEAGSLGAGALQPLMIAMPMDGAPALGARALRTQRTARTHSAGAHILPSLPGGVQPARFHRLPRRAAEGVALGLVKKLLLSKNPGLPARAALFAGKVSHVGGDACLLAAHIVSDRAVFAVRHDRGHLLCGLSLMLRAQAGQPCAFVHVSRSGLQRGDDPVRVIDSRRGQLLNLDDGEVGRQGFWF